jgi:hypothetical protein
MSLDSITEAAARRSAMRFSRRSFIGRFGVGLVAAGTGALGGRVAWAATDVATSCCGCANCGHSTTCATTGGDCPTGTCKCGYWYMCTCGIRETKYQDCCAACSSGCSCGSDGYPRCYYTAPYGSCNGNTKVKCRATTCTQLTC